MSVSTATQPSSAPNRTVWQTVQRVWQGATRLLTAKIALRNCTKVGKWVTVRGFPRVEGNGRIEIGSHVKIWSHLQTTQLSAGTNATIHIGDHTFINTGVILSARREIRIGRHCQLANQVIIMDSNFHGVENRDQPPPPEPVIIEDHVWLATRCTILKGVTIGTGAVVATGAVVTKDVPSHTLVGGVPAKVIRKLK